MFRHVATRDRPNVVAVAGRPDWIATATNVAIRRGRSTLPATMDFDPLDVAVPDCFAIVVAVNS